MFIMSPTLALTEVVREWSEVFMHRSMRDFRKFMEETGLSFSQINILMRLLHGGNTGVSEIGDQLGVTNAAASQAVDRLVPRKAARLSKRASKSAVNGSKVSRMP
jgi:predicted transcriptional regulator